MRLDRQSNREQTPNQYAYLERTRKLQAFDHECTTRSTTNVVPWYSCRTHLCTTVLPVGTACVCPFCPYGGLIMSNNASSGCYYGIGYASFTLNGLHLEPR